MLSNGPGSHGIRKSESSEKPAFSFFPTRDAPLLPPLSRGEGRKIRSEADLREGSCQIQKAIVEKKHELLFALTQQTAPPLDEATALSLTYGNICLRGSLQGVWCRGNLKKLKECPSGQRPLSVIFVELKELLAKVGEPSGLGDPIFSGWNPTTTPIEHHTTSSNHSTGNGTSGKSRPRRPRALQVSRQAEGLKGKRPTTNGVSFGSPSYDPGSLNTSTDPTEGPAPSSAWIPGRARPLYPPPLPPPREPLPSLPLTSDSPIHQKIKEIRAFLAEGRFMLVNPSGKPLPEALKERILSTEKHLEQATHSILVNHPNRDTSELAFDISALKISLPALCHTRTDDAGMATISRAIDQLDKLFEEIARPTEPEEPLKREG